jgi:putative ABC transport system permease protein
VLLDFPLRDYRVLQVGDPSQTESARNTLRLLDDPDSIILTEKFLRRHRLRVGDRVPLTFGSTTRHFTIRAVLLDQGPARTLDGNFALMDIAAAQLAADRLGLLDHVDVLLHPECDLEPEQVLSELQPHLPAGLVAELPRSGSQRADTMIAAFQFNLSALSAVALIVGLFLIYNTVAISVAARRPEIGMLRAVGAGRRTVLTLFLAEASLLAAAGVLVGLPAARWLASLAVTGTAQTVETFYIASVAETSAAALRLGAEDVALVITIVVPLALLAAWIPAREASSTPPVEAIRQPGRMPRKTWLRLATGGLTCLGIGWLLSLGHPIGGRPVLGFLAALVFMFGGAAFTPWVLQLVSGALLTLSTTVLRWRRTEVQLATGNLRAALSRVWVSVAALGVSLSMMIAIAIMVGSFRETVVYWLGSALSADLAIKPVMQSSSVSEARLSPRACRIVASDPDVLDTVWFSSRQLPYQGRNIRLAITEVKKTLERSRLIFKSQPTFQRDGQAGSTPVLVSESFSLLFNAQVGSDFDLPAPAGTLPCRVAGVYYDYASNQGTVMLDIADYDRHYGASDPRPAAQHLSVYLRPEADVQHVRSRILAALGSNERVYCATNQEVRREALRIFESTFAVTYALQLIAILVAGLGVASTLITLIYQRQRDIGLLSLVGATCRQVRRVIVLEAVMLGGASQLIGIGVGTLLAMLLIFVINVQSFGWTIQFHPPWRFIIQSTLMVLAAAALFGIYPAVRAAGVDALQTVREEHA